MCVIIIEGKTRQVEMELGMDYSVPWIGSLDDPDVIEMMSRRLLLEKNWCSVEHL